MKGMELLCQKFKLMQKQEKLPELTVGMRLGAGLGQFHITGGPQGSQRKWQVQFKKHRDSSEFESLNLSTDVLLYLQRMEEVERKYGNSLDRVSYYKKRSELLDRQCKDCFNTSTVYGKEIAFLKDALDTKNRKYAQMVDSSERLVNDISTVEKQRQELEKRVDNQTNTIAEINRSYYDKEHENAVLRNRNRFLSTILWCLAGFIFVLIFMLKFGN